MSKGKFLLGLIAIAALGGAAATGVFGTEQVAQWFPPLKWFTGPGAAAQSQPNAAGPRAVAVVVATAEKRKTPLNVEALGNVTPFASVALKPRIDNEIVAVHFTDGAMVKEGDLLVTLDTRALEAQLAQAQGNLARDRAQFAGAMRDVRRNTELAGKGAGPQLNVENSQTQADTFSGSIRADEATIENLKVQLSYCYIKAPITGRISQASVKVGNFARAADNVPIATINQMAPVYVTFVVPQRTLPEIRIALAEGQGDVEAIIPGDSRTAKGHVSMIENTVDPTTGMATVRATMPNSDELLWPGTLVNARLTLRTEDAVVVPSVAVQVSQQGSYVFVVKDNIAKVTPIKVGRNLGDRTVIESGLNGGEAVVIEGHLLLTNGVRVQVREPKAGA
jgi:membrane fusion protein, multidrug efflux system